jgi:hypothetical protein
VSGAEGRLDARRTPASPGERGPPVVALSHVAAELAELLELLLSLHAFSDDLDAQGVPNIKRGPHDCQVLGILVEILHEHPVQLEEVHG